MPAHYTRKTISAARWCNKCSKETPHAVSDRRIGHCLTCLNGEQETFTGHFLPIPPACSCGRLAFPHVHTGECKVWVVSYSKENVA